MIPFIYIFTLTYQYFAVEAKKFDRRELGADSLECSASVSTYVLYNFKSLITSLTKRKYSQFNLLLFLFPSILSLCHRIYLSVTGLSPRGT